MVWFRVRFFLIHVSIFPYKASPVATHDGAPRLDVEAFSLGLRDLSRSRELLGRILFDWHSYCFFYSLPKEPVKLILLTVIPVSLQ